MVVCEFLLFVTFGMFVLFWFGGFLRWLLVCGALCADTFLWLLLWSGVFGYWYAVLCGMLPCGVLILIYNLLLLFWCGW